jgi:hypothetical protein
MPLRLIHNQLAVTPGAILVDDIDDGLPNKEVYRLGSSGNPKAFEHDGYANKPKQRSYIPRTKIGEPAIPGYIDLQQTPRVVFSAGKGKISKLVRAGFITATVFVPADVVAPTMATAATNTPGAGQMTLTGTTLVSLSPDVTSVTLSTTNAYRLLAGAVSPNGDVLYKAVAPNSTGTAITVRHVVAGLGTALSVSVVGTAITVNSATDGGGLVTSTAADVAAAILASAPASALVTATAQGTGLGLIAAVVATNLVYPNVTLTQTQITGAGGSVGATSIVIPAALVPTGTNKAGDTFARVRANGQLTAAVALT